MHLCGDMTKDRESNQCDNSVFREMGCWDRRCQRPGTEDLMTHLGSYAITVKPPAEIPSD